MGFRFFSVVTRLIVSVTNDSEFEKENCGSCVEMIFYDNKMKML